jgi:recombination protein RecT
MVNAVNLKRTPVKTLVQSDAIQKRFREVLKDRAPQFLSSVVSVVNENKDLQGVDQMSVLNSALVAASVNLPINQNLGFFYLVPYKGVAQAQMGYKGYIQLAQRSGQYQKLNAIPVYADEFGSWNPLTEELDYTPHFEDRKASDKPVGYVGFFKLSNGFEKTVYWSRKQIEAHRDRFSKSASSSQSPWKSDFDAMALKTVLRNLITKWGPMTTDIQKANDADESDLKNNLTVDSSDPKDVTPGSSLEQFLGATDQQQEPTTEPATKKKSEEVKHDELKPDVINDPNEHTKQTSLTDDDLPFD